MDEQKNLGRIYRYKLAEKLRELGYEIQYLSHKDQYWEVKGVPKNVLALFSSRDQEIKKRLREVLREKGIKNRRTRSKIQKYLAFITRGGSKKTEADLEFMRGFWEYRLRKELGLSVEELKERIKGGGKGVDVVEYERKLLALACECHKLEKEKEKLAEEIQKMRRSKKLVDIVRNVISKGETKTNIEKKEKERFLRR